MRENQLNIPVVTAIAILFMACVSLFSGCKAQSVSKLDISMIVQEEGIYRLGDDILFSTGEGNMTLVTSADEATLIDTGYTEEDSKAIVGYIQKHDLKLKNIILTHMHPDHTGNLSTFKTEGVKLYTPSDVKSGDIVEMGDKTFKLITTPGHTGGNSHISIELVKEHVLIAGDVVITNSIPALGGSISEMKDTLNMVKDASYNVILPGHGNIIDSNRAIEQNLEYIGKSEELVAKLIRESGTASALRNIRLEDCISDTSYITPENITELHIYVLNNIYSQLRQDMNKK